MFEVHSFRFSDKSKEDPILQARGLLIGVQDCIEHGEDLFLVFVRVDIKIRIAREHGGEIRLPRVIEEITGLPEALRIGELIAHTEGRAGDLADQQIRLPQPGGVLLVDAFVVPALLQLKMADVLGEDGVCFLDIGDHAVIELRVHTSGADGTRKIDFFVHDALPFPFRFSMEIITEKVVFFNKNVTGQSLHGLHDLQPTKPAKKRRETVPGIVLYGLRIGWYN